MIQRQNLHNFCLLDLVVIMQRNKCTYSNFFIYFYIEKPPAKQLCKFFSHFIIFKKKNSIQHGFHIYVMTMRN